MDYHDLNLLFYDVNRLLRCQWIPRISIDYNDVNGFVGCHHIIGMSVELALVERLPEAQRTKSRLGSQRESQQFGIHCPKLLCAVPLSDLMVFV